MVAEKRASGHIRTMSTLTEIQQAIAGLPATEKKALSVWLSSQQEPEMPADDEAALLASLDKAAQQLDAGLGVASEQARGMVRRWASK
jgi:hypothetical protein